MSVLFACSCLPVSDLALVFVACFCFLYLTCISFACVCCVYVLRLLRVSCCDASLLMFFFGSP